MSSGAGPGRDPGPRWQAALAYAVLGRVPVGLSEPGGVDIEQLLRDLDRSEPDGLAGVTAQLQRSGATRLPAHPVPAELRAGLSAAQLSAALMALQNRLGLGPVTRVTATRKLDADERRLQAEVPPHHGA